MHAMNRWLHMTNDQKIALREILLGWSTCVAGLIPKTHFH